MQHQYLDDSTSGDHWSVGGGTTETGATVLVQLQGEGEQVRIALTPEQAEAMSAALARQATWARGQSRERNRGGIAG